MNSVRHLELIAALATHRHFGKAADALGISQPALTKGLRHLENTLGVSLFDRGGAIAPTVFGDIVLERADLIIKAFSELLREIELTKGVETGHLSISAGLYPAEVSAQEAIGSLSREHPSVLFDLNVKDWSAVLEDVRQARSDLGFADVTVASQSPDLETELVRRCPLLIVCRPGHPLTSLADATLQDLFDYPWAGVSIPNAVEAFLPDAPKPYGVFDPVTGLGRCRLKVETYGAIERVVLNSDAISAAPEVLLGRSGEKKLEVLPVTIPWLGLNYGFIWRRGRSLSPTALAFKATVHRIEREANLRIDPSGSASKENSNLQ